jgi:hypothetical protein
MDSPSSAVDHTAIIYVAISVVPRRGLPVFWSMLLDGVAILLGILALTVPVSVRADKED